MTQHPALPGGVAAVLLAEAFAAAAQGRTGILIIAFVGAVLMLGCVAHSMAERSWG